MLTLEKFCTCQNRSPGTVFQDCWRACGFLLSQAQGSEETPLFCSFPAAFPSPPCPVLSVKVSWRTVFCVQERCQVGLCVGKVGHHSCQVNSLESFHFPAGCWSTSLLVAGLQISPLGTPLATEQPYRLQHPPPSATGALAGRNPEQKSAGMFEM